MLVNLFFNGTPASTSVEPQESASPTSVQGQIKALTAFSNQVSGKATPTDVKDSCKSIKLSGKES